MSSSEAADYLARMAEDWTRNPFVAISNEGATGQEFLGHLTAVLGELAEATARADRHHIELRDKRTDLLEIRGILSPNPSAGQGIPDDVCNRLLGKRAAPAVQWLVDEWLRLAEENARLTEDLATSALPGLGLNDHAEAS